MSWTSEVCSPPPPDLVTEIKIVIEVGPSLSDIQVTAEGPGIGKSVKSVRSHFIDKEQVQSWRSSEFTYQQDDEAGAVRIIDGNAAVAKSFASEYAGPSEHQLELERLVKTLEQFRSLLGQRELVFRLVSFSEVQGIVARLSDDGAMENSTRAQLQEVRMQLEETRFALLSVTQTTRVLSLLQSVKSSLRVLQQDQRLTSLKTQDRSRVMDNSDSEPPASRSQAPSTNVPTPHVEAPNVNCVSESDSQITVIGYIPIKSGWDAEQRYTDAELDNIAAYLKNTGHEDWSTVPRIYAVFVLLAA